MRTRQSSPPDDALSTVPWRRAWRSDPVATFLACGLGSGFSPFAPGTAGSAVALALAWLLALSIAPSHAASVAAGVGLLASGLLLGAVGVPLSTRVARASGAKDPGCVVIDEFAGQFLAASPLPLFSFPSGRSLAAGWFLSFFFFRLFDVWKPGPIRRSQDLPEGLGIVVDDILAGLLAAGATAAASAVISRWS